MTATYEKRKAVIESADKPVSPNQRWIKLQAVLGVSNAAIARFLSIAPNTVLNWRKTGPRLTPDHRSLFINLGLNPGYLDGVGEMLLPKCKLEDVILALRGKK